MLAAATVVGLSPSVAAPAAMASNFPTTSDRIAGFSASTATVISGLSGIGRSHPRLSFDIRTAGGLPITTVKVALPAGLTFSTRATDRRRGVRVTGSTKSGSTVRRGALFVSLTGASHHLHLTLTGPALEESKSLLARVVNLARYNATHPTAPHGLSLKLTVTVASGTKIAIKVPVTFAFH